MKVPLPPRSIDEPPIYVNQKQYNRILIMRMKKDKQAQHKKKRKETRKKYDSRSKHAQKRTRGPNGRFLSRTNEDEEFEEDFFEKEDSV